jgi:hypothetical protein
MSTKDTLTKNRGVGRPRRSDSIKDRAIYVYLPSKLLASEWKSLANEQGQSISKFVQERVEQSLNQTGIGPRYSRKELIDRTQALEEENRILRQNLDVKSKAYKALESELEILRVQPYLNPLVESVRGIRQELVAIFRARKMIAYDELLSSLDVRSTEIEVIKAINNQIEVLTGFGLIKPEPRGWRWVE